jgi:hypothetical protein
MGGDSEKNKRPLLSVVGLSARIWINIHTGPMLESTAPFPQALLALTPTPNIPLNPISTHVTLLAGRRRHKQAGIFLWLAWKAPQISY